MKNKLSDLVINKVYSATTLSSKEGDENLRRSRPSWAILIKYEGETVYLSNGKRCISNAESIMLLPAGSRYRWKCVKGGHYSVVEFEAAWTCEEVFCFPVKSSERLLSLIKGIEQRSPEKHPLYQMEGVRDVYTILLELLRSSEQSHAPSAKKRKLLPALEYIEKHYAEKLGNDELSALTGLSTVYFRKLFVEVYGISPINYVIQRRIKKAKEMLNSDYASITDIAVTLGYASIYDFSREFKKHVGVPPSKFVIRNV